MCFANNEKRILKNRTNVSSKFVLKIKGEVVVKEWYFDPQNKSFQAQIKDFQALMEISTCFGGTQNGGLHRLTGTAEDHKMRDHFCEWLQHNDFKVHIDPLGNIFGYFEFDSKLPYILCGSHLDSQPFGGQYDGVYGVLSAAATLKHIQLQVHKLQLKPTHNLAVVCWTNEEGARFQPSLTGSSYYSGQLSLEKAWQCQDIDQITLKQALQNMGYLGQHNFEKPVARYLELHIEQGGILEQHQKTIGIVEGTWAALKLKIQFKGEQNHTGPAPMAIRKDALLGAARTIVKIREYASRYPERIHSSVGKLENFPNSPNIVPERTTLYIELRSAEEDLLIDLEQQLWLDLKEITQETATEYELLSRHFRGSIVLDPSTQEQLIQSATCLGLSVMRLKTIAGHDAISLSHKVPSNLIFIPSQSGLSHNEAEYSTLEDLTSGIQLLTHFLAQQIGLFQKTGEKINTCI